MRRVSKIMLSLVMILAIIGSSAVYASSPSKGMKGSNNEILSKITTFAGSGEFSDVNGGALDASFREPHRIAVLSDGSVLVSDKRNHLIRKISNEEVITYAGFTLELNELGYPLGGRNDDSKEKAIFSSPAGMAVDETGHIYLADAENHAIRKIDTDGNVTTLAGNGLIGEEDGIGEAARFHQPLDVAVAKDGTIYVADTLNHLIRRITPAGEVTTLNALSDRTVQLVEGSVEPVGDYQDGKLKEAKFNEPSGIAIDNAGNLFISDTGNRLIRYIDFSAGTVSTVAGFKQSGDSIYAENAVNAEGGYLDGTTSEAKFLSPKGIALTSEGGLLIADTLNHSIRYLIDGQVMTLAGDPSQEFGEADGINGHNSLFYPTDVAVLPNGSVLIADSYNDLIRQFKLYRLPAHLPQNNEVKVVLNDEIILFDTEPELVKGRTMIPVRALTEEMGYLVEFDAGKQAVYLTNGDIRIVLFVGQLTMTIEQEGKDKVEKEIDAAPYIKNGRTYAPIRFFSEEFGLDVQWSQSHKTVILRNINE
jgi:sugar lactone lactonase YvrE